MKEVKFKLRTPHLSDNLNRKNISKFKLNVDTSGENKESSQCKANTPCFNRNKSPDSKLNPKGKHFLRIIDPSVGQTLLDTNSMLNNSFYEEIYKKFAITSKPKLALTNELNQNPNMQPQSNKATNNIHKENPVATQSNENMDSLLAQAKPLRQQNDIFPKDFALPLDSNGLSSSCLNSKLIKISSANLPRLPLPNIQSPSKKDKPQLTIINKKKEKNQKINVLIQGNTELPQIEAEYPQKVRLI